MLNSSKYNEILSFDIASAKLWYGNNPTEFGFRSPGEDEPEKSIPTLYFNLVCQDSELRRLIGKGSVIAYIYRHPTDKMTFKDGVVAKGHLSLYVGDKDENKRYLVVEGILPEYSFDAFTTALTFNSNEMLAHSHLLVGLNQPRSQINFDKSDSSHDETTVYVELLGIHFELGNKEIMINEECCENCKYGAEIVEDLMFDSIAAKTAMLCHRFSPMPAPFVKKGKTKQYIWAWPVVGKKDWCGEYKPKDEQNDK